VYLKKLSLQGFKSFANRTNFEYGRGVTAIVGPNGSGKSNVSDALRWVLGEQSGRLLRARKQEDVIFSGTKDRAAVGMAEVVLTLDNEDKWLPVDFAEVEVGRRVYRNGDSEYLLNGSRVRLRDIIDLLMKGDVGQNSYSIMGQGLVDEVLSMSPDERRGFLDEAADVKRFRLKIKEAQDRLGATRENIDRVTLIIKELEPQLSRLQRQAERAAEHRRLSAELIELFRAYYTHRWSEAQNNLVRTRAALDQRMSEGAAAAARVEQLREQLHTLGEEIRKRRDAIARRDNRTTEIEQRLNTIEQSITLDRERHAMITARREEVRLEIDALESERISLSTTDADEGRRGLEVAGETDTVKGDLLHAREALEVAERDYAAARSRAAELRDGAEADNRHVASLAAEVERSERRMAELALEEEKSLGRRSAFLGELKTYGTHFRDLRADMLNAEFRLDTARVAAQEARERLNRLQEEARVAENAGSDDQRELDRLEGRYDALRRVQAEHEGVTVGTRNALIMGQALIEGMEPGSLGEPPEVPGVIGLLARQIKVPAGLEMAINAALEYRLHAIVVEKEVHALKAIEMLRERHQGRAQFLPLESVHNAYPVNLQKERGVVGVAAKLVRSDARMKSLIDTLLGRIIVVEDADTALRMIRRGLGSVVTLDGSYFEASGVISGGGSGTEEGAFSRQREIEELPDRIAALESRVATNDRKVKEARAVVETLAVESRELESSHESLRRALEVTRFDLERERERLHRLRRELDGVRGKRSSIERERIEREQMIARSAETIASLTERGGTRSTSLVEVENELRMASDRREASLRSVSEASARLAAVEGEKKALQAMREQHERAIERLAGQVSARRMQARQLELEASVIDERLGKLARDLEAIHAEKTHSNDDVAPDQDELHRLETHERQIQEEFSEAQTALLAVDRARLDIEADVNRATELIENLRSEMEREGLAPDRTGSVVPLDEAAAMPPLFENEEGAPSVQGAAIVDVAETRRRIEAIRGQIRRLGPINEEAPEDFEESNTRYEFLTTQMRDLADAETQLREAIGRLSEEIRERFSKTFEQVNKSFSEYFESFFGGGNAKLLLTDPDNVAESGIEIEASPPGKRIKSLSLLSGGERSLTAVALLFALLTANPAPFCVLDEVDAALDEANVGRFTAALKKLAERTQFLIVTHNRRTIEIADAIYGVSMGRDGVSKVLSLRLADIAQQ
jgi:chromosome segregation protein